MAELKADWQNHHIEGYARAAMERGMSSHFSAPLISHIEGNLWSGGCIHGVNLADKFDTIFSLYPWERYSFDKSKTKLVEVKMYDSADLYDELDAVAEKAYEAVQNGVTLIHCQAGLNRSGLVAALVLRRMGYTSKEAIELLRKQRSPMVLCNETFEKHLLSLDEDDA